MTHTEFVIHVLGSMLFCIGLIFRDSQLSAIGYGMMAMGLICLTFRMDGDK